jgi:hypothetical protein
VERQNGLPGREARITQTETARSADGWRRSSRGGADGGRVVPGGRQENRAAGIAQADAVEPSRPSGGFARRCHHTRRAMGGRLEVTEDVVMGQRQERRRQDVRGEQHSCENAALGRTHDIFSIQGSRGSGFGATRIVSGVLSAFINARGAPPPLALARRLRAALGPQALAVPSPESRTPSSEPHAILRSSCFPSATSSPHARLPLSLSA